MKTKKGGTRREKKGISEKEGKIMAKTFSLKGTKQPHEMNIHTYTHKFAVRIEGKNGKNEKKLYA